MTEKKAKEIIIALSREYLAFGNQLTIFQVEDWTKELITWDLKIAKEVIGDFRRKYPATVKNYAEGKTEYAFGGFMPPIEEIRSLYLQKTAPRIPDCPCCDNTRFIYLGDKVAVCDCKKGGFKGCRNWAYCNPTDKVKCPLGKEHYQEKKRQEMERLSKDPAFDKGYKMLHGHGKQTIDKLTKEIAEEIPF